MPDIVDTDIPDEDDGLEDLNPPIVNEDYGVADLQDIPYAIAETVQEHNDPEQELEVPGDLQVPDPDDEVDQDLQEPPEPIPEVPDPRAIQPRHSQRTRAKPQRLIPTLNSTKTYQSTAAVTTHLTHPEEHEDPNYLVVADYVMTQYSMKAGMKHFKESGEKAVSKELYQLHFCDTFEPINPKDLTPEEDQDVLDIPHVSQRERKPNY